ncbi:putative uncharacterized phage protein [Moritella viscosa]|nr:PIN-like domain-containing protein [Moritella viscosa]CED59833.1 putative uncharacterized phage protein [Moritella viscosa]SHO03490.1 Putative uncharacterized protein [Moritella viscosa]
MKSTFKHFHNLSSDTLIESWQSDKTMFVFDTNVLLNLYGYAAQTRDDFFKILAILDDRLWLPYHVGLEYQRRRLDIIKSEKAIFSSIDKNLDKIQKIFDNDFTQLALKRRFPKLFESTNKLQKDIHKNIIDYKKSVSYWDKSQPCVKSHDPIRNRINDCFDGRVGEKPDDQASLDKIYNEGKDRYEKRIPPGFSDAGKSQNKNETHFYSDGLYYERQYGDLILWKQLLEKAKDEGIESVIFVTDDAKEDWWYKLDSNGNKQIGPLAELQAEIYRESKITAFHMYSTSAFLTDGKSHLAVDVEESSIEDADVRQTDVAHNKSLFVEKITYNDSDESNEEYLSLVNRIVNNRIHQPDVEKDKHSEDMNIFLSQIYEKNIHRMLNNKDDYDEVKIENELKKLERIIGRDSNKYQSLLAEYIF